MLDKPSVREYKFGFSNLNCMGIGFAMDGLCEVGDKREYGTCWGPEKSLKYNIY